MNKNHEMKKENDSNPHQEKEKKEKKKNKGLSNKEDLYNILKQYEASHTLEIKSRDFVFSYKGYSEEKLGHYLTEEQFESIIFQINKLTLKALIKYRKQINVKINKFIYLFMIVILIFFAGGLFFLIEANNYSKTSVKSYNLPLLFSIIFFLCVCVSLLVLSINNFKLKSQIKTIPEQTHINIEQFLTFLNVQFQDKLVWKYIPNEQIIKIYIVDVSENAYFKGLTNLLVEKKQRNKSENVEKKKLRKIFEENDDENKQIENELFNQWWNADNNVYDGEEDINLIKDKKLGEIRPKKMRYRDLFREFTTPSNKEKKIQILKDTIGYRKFNDMLEKDSKKTDYYEPNSTLY